MYMLRSVFCGLMLGTMVFSVQAGTSPAAMDLHTGKVPFTTPVVVPVPEVRVHPVPEPNTILLGLSGFGAMLALRRMFFR